MDFFSVLFAKKNIPQITTIFLLTNRNKLFEVYYLEM